MQSAQGLGFRPKDKRKTGEKEEEKKWFRVEEKNQRLV
jgi:hypothetical protein